MVRAFAASAGYLRQNLGRLFQEEEAQTPPLAFYPARPLFDTLLPIFVVLFLVTIAVGAILQFRSSRQATLGGNENALFLAGDLLAMKIKGVQEKGGKQTADLLLRLPVEMQAQGRRFLVLDEGGKIVLASGGQPKSSEYISDFFVDAILVPKLIQEKSIRQFRLASGEMASVAAFALPSPYSALLAFQPLKDELIIWSQDASILAALLMCCGVVTLSFTLAFCAQRSCTRSLGDHASRMQTQFETALNRSNCGLWECSLEDGTITFSKSMFRLLGLEEHNNPIARTIVKERLHGEDISPLEMIDVFRHNGANELDHLFRLRHADDRWIWLRMRAVRVESCYASPAVLIGIVMDVTDERNAELESHRADARLRDAIESISEAFVLWDESDKMVMCNSKYRTFHDFPASNTLRGENYAQHKQLIKNPQVPAGIERTENHFQPGNRSYEAQFGDGRWLLVSERNTKHGGRVIVGTDITARKHQEEKLIENERQLRITIRDLGSSREALHKQAKQLAELATLYQEQKMEVISASRLKAEFLANMNHEIRTPLNHIIGFAEMIELQVCGGKGNERYSEYARDIRESGENLLTLISDILDMARIEAGRVHLNRAPYMVGVILDDASLQVLDDAKEKNISLHVEPEIHDENGQRMINVDRGFLGQALAYLLRNSIRLSPIGGRVSMRARIVGDYVNIFIADTGYTISASDLSAMACPFGHIDGMLHDGCKGSGLGMAIARSLIELHGGTLRMRALPEQGSIAMVRLPISMQSAQLFLPITDFTPFSLH